MRRPYRDTAGSKSWLALLAHAQPHAVRRYALTLPGWPRFNRPLRIVLLSDLHVGSHTDDIARFEAVIAEAQGLAPDLVLLGGDFVNMQVFGGGRVPPHIVAGLLSPLVGAHGRFAILGNHDYIYGDDDVAEALRDHGIVVLDHERQAFSYEGHAISILGVPDLHVVRPKARALLAALTAERPAIVLTHDPVWFADVPAGPFLTVAGHTHGGQIKLPGVGILTNASRAPRRWTYGLVIEEGRHLVVTAGLGTSGIPLRIGVPPEFVIIEVTGM